MTEFATLLPNAFAGSLPAKDFNHFSIFPLVLNGLQIPHNVDFVCFNGRIRACKSVPLLGDSFLTSGKLKLSSS